MRLLLMSMAIASIASASLGQNVEQRGDGNIGIFDNRGGSATTNIYTDKDRLSKGPATLWLKRITVYTYDDPCVERSTFKIGGEGVLYVHAAYVPEHNILYENYSFGRVSTAWARFKDRVEHVELGIECQDRTYYYANTEPISLDEYGEGDKFLDWHFVDKFGREVKASLTYQVLPLSAFVDPLD